jgi:hypothetical protein
MDKTKCPVCGKLFVDILRHFVLEHDVKDMNRLEELVKKYEENEQRKKCFRDFVESLKAKLKEDKITPEEYREQTMKWWKEQT